MRLRDAVQIPHMRLANLLHLMQAEGDCGRMHEVTSGIRAAPTKDGRPSFPDPSIILECTIWLLDSFHGSESLLLPGPGALHLLVIQHLHRCPICTYRMRASMSDFFFCSCCGKAGCVKLVEEVLGVGECADGVLGMSKLEWKACHLIPAGPEVEQVVLLIWCSHCLGCRR